PRIVRLFFAAPKQVTNMQLLGDFPPVQVTIHQLIELVKLRPVFKSFSPEVSRISQNNIPSFKQQRVIVGRIGGKSRLDRQIHDRVTNSVNFGAIGEAKTRPSGGQSSE